MLMHLHPPHPLFAIVFVFSFRTLLGHTGPISSLSWNDAEGLLLSGSWDETARAWDLETATCKWTLGGHEVGSYGGRTLKDSML